MRSPTIWCVALLLFAALVAGPCASCFDAPHSCCGNCEKSSKCAAPSVNLNHLQTVDSGIAFSLDQSGVAEDMVMALAQSRSTVTVEVPYSPPDLYLRNSVLNI